MAMVVVIVFLGVFAVTVALIFAFGKTPSRQTKKVIAALDSAIAADGQIKAEKKLNFRKNELLSARKSMRSYTDH